VAPNLELRGIAEYTALNEFAFALSSDGETVFIDVASGDLHRVVAAPADGASSLRTLLTVTGRPFSFDAAKDGSLYIDQVDTSLAVMRVRDNNAGAFPESLVKSTAPPEYCSAVLPLSDGGVLYPAQLSGRRRLFVASPGKEPKAFTDAAIEESSPPITRVGVDTIGFLLGTAPKQVIALASAADGRLQRRIDIPQGAQITCMAGSPDGKAIYYISNSTLWMLPAAGGEARKLTAADAIALHPKTGEIVLQRNAAAGVRYFRYDASSGREQQIEIRSAEARPGVGPLSSRAIAADGRMVLPINVPDLWAWSVGLFDPVSQSIKRVPMLTPSGGLNSVAWTDDGQIVFTGVTWQSSIWRFRSVAEASQNR
jgi:sugar lactone lactonase YvrE